jgi:hypothetical protein
VIAAAIGLRKRPPALFLRTDRVRTTTAIHSTHRGRRASLFYRRCESPRSAPRLSVFTVAHLLFLPVVDEPRAALASLQRNSREGGEGSIWAWPEIVAVC